MNAAMSLLTHFGAIALLTPFALVIALWLWRAVGRAAALWWCLCVAGVGLTVALAKVCLAACAPAWIAHALHPVQRGRRRRVRARVDRAA